MITILFSVLCSLLILPTQGVEFLPTEFVPMTSLGYSANENINLQINLCDAYYYENCLMEARVNLPFDLWNFTTGITVQYQIVGGPNCDRLYCQNEINSKNPFNCSFFLPPDNGPILYYVSKAGNSPSIPATFNLQVMCNITGNSTYQKYGDVCPTNATDTRKNIKIETPASVLTSPYNPIYFQFVTCPSTDVSANTNFDFVLTATDRRSAFSTYICESDNSSFVCSPSSSPAGWYDATGSGINIVSQQDIPAGILSAAVFGWGDFNDQNNFVFNIAIYTASPGS